MDHEVETGEVGRRTVLKRTALIGGTMVWATPVVQSIAGPALATTGSPGQGAPSYVIVFILCDGLYYQVKFEQSGGDGECLGSGENGLSGDAANDPTCLEGYRSAKGNFTYQESCDAISPTSTVGDGFLEVHLDAGCTLVGWFLHDGTCAGDVTTGNGKCRFSNDPNTGSDPVGPDIPDTGTGRYLFDKCL